MAEDWSPEEVAATVADYFAMLECERRGEPYNKSAHRRQLQLLLRGRSSTAIEFKHANISAVLLDGGFPRYIDGYKPRSNYQALLRQSVLDHLAANRELVAATARVAIAPALEVPALRPLTDILVPAPVRERQSDRTYERPVVPPTPLLGINYLEREARNASLGEAGEAFVLQLEHRRLWEAGQRTLADRIEHVSQTKGDGLGYDIASFETNGTERLIEVKTTGFGAMTPFFASKCEVMVSDQRAEQYQLYRVFKFRELPKVFVLSGSLRQSCILDAIAYRASLA